MKMKKKEEKAILFVVIIAIIIFFLWAFCLLPWKPAWCGAGPVYGEETLEGPPPEEECECTCQERCDEVRPGSRCVTASKTTCANSGGYYLGCDECCIEEDEPPEYNCIGALGGPENDYCTDLLCPKGQYCKEFYEEGSGQSVCDCVNYHTEECWGIINPSGQADCDAGYCHIYEEECIYDPLVPASCQCYEGCDTPLYDEFRCQVAVCLDPSDPYYLMPCDYTTVDGCFCGPGGI